MRRLGIMAIAVLLGLLLAGEAWAQAGWAADCPQPAEGDATYRLQLDDRGALLPSCLVVLRERLDPAVRAATDIVVFASGWRADPAGRTGIEARFLQELRGAA